MFQNDEGVMPTLSSDTLLGDLLLEPVLFCDEEGIIYYANPAAQQWSDTPLVTQPFTAMLQPDSRTKGQRFFAEARSATQQHPTDMWELTLGNDTNYRSARFHGCTIQGLVVVVAQLDSPEMATMQQEMLDLTSELSEAQRHLRRQNRNLQRLLDEQQQLTRTIQELRAPIVPIWEGAVLVPLVGHMNSTQASTITDQVLQQVQTRGVDYVILDVSGVAVVDTDVAHHLLALARSLRLLGVRPVLVGITPNIAESIVHLGVDLKGFLIQSDLQHAIAYVLRQLKGR